MSRQKLYPQGFIVRATIEELRLIDERARESKTSRSRFLVTTALTSGCRARAADLPLLEAMLESRGMTLVELRRVRHRLERVADLLGLLSQGRACDPDLGLVIEDLATTTKLVKKVWAPLEQ